MILDSGSGYFISKLNPAGNIKIKVSFHKEYHCYAGDMARVIFSKYQPTKLSKVNYLSLLDMASLDNTTTTQAPACEYEIRNTQNLSYC